MITKESLFSLFRKEGLSHAINFKSLYPVGLLKSKIRANSLTFTFPEAKAG